VAEIYTAWRRGEPGMGPHLIDQLGRVVATAIISAPKKEAPEPPKIYRPGQIGAMIADYKAHDVYLVDIGGKTRLENGRVDPNGPTFGETYWKALAPGPMRTWLHPTQFRPVFYGRTASCSGLFLLRIYSGLLSGCRHHR
jgi:hypothetical protein